MINKDLYEITGYRFISPYYNSTPEIGEILAKSYIWDGDEQTEDELNGTCAFESREMVEKYAKYSKGWIVRIGGENKGWGELEGELLIGEAEVLEVEKWN